MEIVVGFYAFIGLIIWFLHNMVDEKIGTSAKDHVDFWLEMIVILALAFTWLLPPAFFVRSDTFVWLCDISSGLYFFVSTFAAVFWWALPFIAIAIASDSPINLIAKLPPIERRLCANYERAAAFYKGMENGKPKSIDARVDEFDPPEEEVFDESGIAILPVTTPRQAKDFILDVEQLKKDAQAPLTEEIVQRSRSTLSRVLKKRTRSVVWRLAPLIALITAFFCVCYHLSHF